MTYNDLINIAKKNSTYIAVQFLAAIYEKMYRTGADMCDLAL